MKQKLILDAAKDLLDKKNHIIINEENKNNYKSNTGDYYLIKYNEYNVYQNEKLIINQVKKALRKLLKKYNISNHPKVLVVGLGNASIIADSLGPKTTEKMIATNHYDDFLTIPKVAILNPSIVYKTGIKSFDIIKMVNDSLKPDFLLFIDTMQTTDFNNVNKIIEINDQGIIPGSYLNINKEINVDTFSKPIISIGIPLIYSKDDTQLTIPNINEVVENTSNIISKALNSLFLD